jgi:hypothetical protein
VVVIDSAFKKLNMKINQIGLFIFLVVVLATGCKREEFDSVPQSGEVLTSLAGSWTLKRVIQKDETAEIKNSPFVTLDLTPLFPYTEYKLTLTSTGSATGDYTAVPGASPQIIRSNTGKWIVDDIKNPRFVSFVDGTDTTRMEIGSYPTSFNSGFKLKQTKIDVATGKPAISYNYEFSKQ